MQSNAQVVTEDVPEETGYLMVKSSLIMPFPEQPRKHFDDKSIEELADSIEEDEQRTPILICSPQGALRKKYQGELNEFGANFILKDGERRLRACNRLAERRNESYFLMKATVEVGDDVEKLFGQSFGANFQSEDMAPLEIAAGLERIYQNEPGMTFESLARRYGKSMKYIMDYYSLNGLHPGVKELMDPARPKRERLRVTHAIQIARVKNLTKQLNLAKETLDMSLGVQDLRSSIDGQGLQLKVTQSSETGFYQPRQHRTSDDRAILTNLLRKTENSLSKFAARVESGSVDMEDMYLGSVKGDEVFEHYIELLTKAGESIVTITEAIRKAMED